MATLAALSGLGRGGRRLAEIAAGSLLLQGCSPVCWGKAGVTSPHPGGFATETRFSPMFRKRLIPFKGGTSVEPLSLGRDDSPTRQLQLVRRY